MPIVFQPTPSTLKSADILLINPDFSKNEMGVASAPENHLGLNRIASYLAKQGKSSQIIDTTGQESSTTGPEELGDWLLTNADGYGTIGFHSNSWNINHILRTLERAKAKLKDKKLIFGGPLANSEPLKMMELLLQSGTSNIGVVQGLGEKITEEILNKKNLNEVEGLWTVSNGEILKGRKVALDHNEFEALPFLSLEHNTFYQNYYKPVLERGDLGEFGMEIIFGSQGLEVNRGCPFQCTYCSVPQYEERLLIYSPKRVVDELEHLAREAGFFMFTFTNSNIMFYRREWMAEFCEEILKRKMEHYLRWTAYHHPSVISWLDVADYDLMRRAGSDTIVFGVQSFEEKICRIFARPPNTKELTKIIREKSREAHQELTVDYITGVPGEDLDIVEEAFNYFIENDVECRNYQLKFYPNTKLPMRGLDLSGHDLVPITGNLAPELEAYAVVPKHANPRAAQLDGMIREHSAGMAKKRPVRLGNYLIENPKQAQEILNNVIPNDPYIPEKVKRAMSIALREMLSPKKRTQKLADLSPKEMMKVIVMAGRDAPPMVKAMQAKLRDSLGPGKFETLRAQYEQAGL